MLLAALHSTGNVERALKDVALQYTPERASLVGGTVNDLVIVDTHAPKVEDIASKADIPGSTSKICPKGDYMGKILNAYRKIFGGRPWSRKPKLRRDKNISRKKQAATTITEAHVCRQREEAVAGLVAAMEGKLPGVIQSFVGAVVPADKPEDDSKEMHEVRDKAEKGAIKTQVGRCSTLR